MEYPNEIPVHQGLIDALKDGFKKETGKSVEEISEGEFSEKIELLNNKVGVHSELKITEPGIEPGSMLRRFKRALKPKEGETPSIEIYDFVCYALLEKGITPCSSTYCHGAIVTTIFTENHSKQKRNRPTSIVTSPKPVKKYIAVLSVSYDDLTRAEVEAIIKHLKTITGDDNIKLTKMEKGSVKIYFETSSDLSEDIMTAIDSIEGIKIKKASIIDELTFNTGKPDKSVYHWRTFIRPEFFENIHNPGAAFTHSKVDNLALKDLYVSPNLKVLNIEQKKDNVEEIINAEEVLAKKIGTPIKIVVYGTDNSGKSTLVRWCYDKYYEKGYIPILISGNDVKDVALDRIKKLVQKEYSRQYTGIIDGNLEDFDPDRIIIIIDDFHRIRFTKSKFKASLVSNLNKGYQNVILTGNELMRFESYSSKSGISRNILEDFKRYEIIEFGPILRYELIKKWNCLGREPLEPNEVIRLNKETEKHVDSIIGKNFVPSYPVYLLTILQAKELSSPTNPEFSLHGFYYELLIHEALNKAVKNKADISLFYNFITDYTYFLFENKIRFEPLFIDDFVKFHLKYCQDYKIKVSYNYILDTLINSKILKRTHDSVAISYKYVYYFFVARYLANNISKDEIRKKVVSLCQRVHRDEFASIVMFLTHLSKDQFIINQLLENSKTLFKEYAPVKLEEDVSFVNEMINKLPEQLYEPIDPEKVKEEELREDEKLNMLEKEFDAQKDVYEYDINEDISTLDELSKFIKAIKTIEIVGQVTKKYWGELKAQQKFDLAEETYMLGLRTLGFYYSLIGKDTQMLIEYLKYIHRKKQPDKIISKEEIEKRSRNYLFGLCVMASLGVIKRVTNAIGYDKLEGTFEDILSAHNYTSVKLIDTSIKLDYNQRFPWDEIKVLKRNTDKHFLSNAVLQNLVINYLYVFHTTYEDKQRICSFVGIKMDQQRMIDATSRIKKESNN